MIWFVVAALGAWSFYQGRRIVGLERRIDGLLRTLEVLSRKPDVQAAIHRETVPTPAPEAADPVAETWDVAPSREPAAYIPEAEPLETPAPAPPALQRPQGLNLAAWLSENGLAWLGGGALALGGIFLVTYAAQRGVFTPALRVWAAVVAGLAMIGASEWIRRLEARAGRPHALAAAVAAGAGAATLYGAIWASERLYHFIGLEMAAPLLGLVSAGLLGLAWRHGAPLAVLALCGAYLVPAITRRADWSDGALNIYLILILVTGYASAGARRWGAAGLVAGLGAAIWGLAETSVWRGDASTLLLALPPALALAAHEGWRFRDPNADDPRELRLMFPVALITGCLASPLLWTLVPRGQAPVALSVTLVAFGTAGAIRRRGPAMLQAAPYLVAVLCVGIQMLPEVVARGTAARPMVVALALAAGGLAAAFTARDRADRLWAASGAVASAVAFGLSALVLRQVWPAAPWAGAAAGALLLALAATVLARRTAAPGGDLPLALWIWSATALVLQTLAEAFDPRALPAIFAAAALAGAVLQSRLGWRGLSSAAVAAAIAALGALLGPALAEPILRGVGNPMLVAAVSGVAAILTAAAGFAIGRGAWGRRDVGEALNSGAIVLALAGAFLVLRGVVGQPHGVGLDPLSESGIRAVLLMAAGVLARPGRASGPIARWRPHVLILAGVAHGILFAGLVFNPLWSRWPLAGPPLLDTLALAFLAPALLLAAATRGSFSSDPRWAGPYGGIGLGFGLAWALLEIRRLCHGPAAGSAPLGRIEAAADALVLLGVVIGLWIWATRARRRPEGLLERAAGLEQFALAASWVGLILADLAYFHLASPWWGPVTRPLGSVGEAALLGLCYGAGVVATLFVWRRVQGRVALGRFALVSAVLQLFVLVTLAIRFGFRGLDMAPSAIVVARVETWAFSAIWAAYGLAVLVGGVRRGDIALRWTGLALLLFTTAKVLLFDMARLDGMVRAASFLALGVLLILGALAARRMGALDFGHRDRASGPDTER